MTIAVLTALSTICLFCYGIAATQPAADSTKIDTVAVKLSEPVLVIGHRVTQERTRFPFAKELFGQVLVESGFGLVTKGVFLAKDIQADGFKRDDISVVIDGERYHSACPNRMDSPLARSNPLEMEAIDLNKTSSACCSGIGGSVVYRRERIGEESQIRAGISQSLGAYEASDVGFAGTLKHHRLAGRYAKGSGYTDGDGNSFVTRYGYKKNYTYRLAETSITGVQSDFTYRGEFTYTDNVMFPYLMMDERTNRVFSGSLEFRNHKLYGTYTNHTMDNGLRNSMMSMRTDAINTTIGVTGPLYEAYYRRWKADNRISSSTMLIENKLMPSVNQLAASLFQESVYKNLTYWARVGLSSYSIEDKDRATFYEALYENVETSRLFLTSGAGIAHLLQLRPDVAGVISADFASEPPTPQALFIAVQRSMTSPWWSGNPGLHNPLRGTIRSRLDSDHYEVEASFSHVWDYIDLSPSSSSSGRSYLTYKNFDAVIAAINLKTEWKYFQAAGGYTWAERRKEGTPLAEVPPFHLTYTLTSPELARGTIYLRHTYNSAQNRIDASLSESPTAAWHRIDFGLRYQVSTVILSLEVDNLFDRQYSQHLSYLRDPFASGTRVYEPGRTVWASVELMTSSKSEARK